MAIEPIDTTGKAILDLINSMPGQGNSSGTQNHEQLQGLLGGNSSGHYHLTETLLNKLINLPADGGGNGNSTVSISVGSVTTGAAGTNASVTNSGTSTNAIFDFVIPRGDKGDKGDKGSSGDASYRLVKKFFADSSGDVNTPSDLSRNNFDFTVPEGVNRIYISGSAGGGGLYTNGNVIQSGWSGGQCLGAGCDVNPGDLLHISVGLGGAMNCSGQDTVVTRNGIEIFRLLGGGSKNHDGYTPSEYFGMAKIDTPPLWWTLWYSCSPAPDSVSDTIALANSKNIHYDDLLNFLLHSLLSPRTLFPPYGEGGCLLSDNRRRIRTNSGFEGKSGIVILDFVQQIA